MTLVWRTRSGSLIQTEVGTVDVVNTYSAARTVYGWMGGTDGLRFLLERIPNAFGQRLKHLKLDQNLRLMPFKGYVLTGHGPQVAHMDDAQKSFGGDLRTQIIGTTLCALAHECELVTAARLFCRFLMPYLFGGPNPIVDALQSQLMENATLQRILNEGASRGLNGLFNDIVTKLNLPVAMQGWRRTKLGDEDREFDFFGEVNMIGGLLRWIAQDGASEYHTRSSAVARLAAYLKAVGYNLGDIEIWNGEGVLPGSIGTKRLVLVLGGSSETDQLMGEQQQIPDQPLILHYQHSTTGTMLLSAMQSCPGIRPEVLQEDFEQVLDYLQDNVRIGYVHDEGTLYAMYHWKPTVKKPSPISTRLASVCFPDLAEFVAPCFDRIANQRYLDMVKGQSRKVINPHKKELGRFRAIVASVAISIISRFASKTFKDARHATTLDISWPEDLSSICKVLDQDKIATHQVVKLLASIHAARDFDEFDKMTTNLVAWRNGIYGVIPSLLFDMKPSPNGFEFVCLDQFWANVKVRENGSIHSAYTPHIERYEIDTNHLPINTELSALDRLGEPSLGSPDLSPPDCPLYLSLGTPMHTDETQLCFVAWVRGSIAGTAGIFDALKVLVLSRVEPDTCPGHDNDVQVLNVKTSGWTQDLYSKPTSRHCPVFLPASGDHGWAIFAASQTVNEGGRIVFRCPNCAIEKYVKSLPSRSGPEDLGCFVGLA